MGIVTADVTIHTRRVTADVSLKTTQVRADVYPVNKVVTCTYSPAVQVIYPVGFEERIIKLEEVITDYSHTTLAKSATYTEIEITPLKEVYKCDYSNFTLYRQVILDENKNVLEDKFFSDAQLTILRSSKYI